MLDRMITSILKYEIKGFDTGLRMVVEVHEHELLSFLDNYSLDRFRNSHPSD